MNEKTQELLDRTFNFGVNTLKLLKKLPDDSISHISKMEAGKSAVSVGANYDQAQGSASKKEFTTKISASHREAKQNIYWMRVLSTLHDEEKYQKEFAAMLKEAQELRQIFGASVKTVKKTENQN
jgi:four helix bundle protein